MNHALPIAGTVIALLGIVLVYKAWWNLCFDAESDMSAFWSVVYYAAPVVGSLFVFMFGLALIVVFFFGL